MEASSQAQAQSEAQADLQALDEACDNVAVILGKCAEHVNAGRLQGDEIMLRMHRLYIRLTGGAPAEEPEEEQGPRAVDLGGDPV